MSEFKTLDRWLESPYHKRDRKPPKNEDDALDEQRDKEDEETIYIH